jgi:glycosyltransferase involved in cell wall biosynthesis
MRITVAMPVRNGAATIAVAIRSCLSQTFRDWRLEVIDDGSSDDTVAVARAFRDERISVLQDGRHVGLAARLNESIDRCATGYFARLDADDVAYPERFERQVEFLERHSGVDLLGTAALVFGDDGRPIGLFPYRENHADICRDPWSGFYLAHPTWMGRAAWFRRHRYRSDLPKSQDQDLLLRTFRSSEFACLPQVLNGYRQDRLSIGKLTRSRWHFSRALARAAWQHGAYFQVVAAPARQALKGAFEVVTLSTGLAAVARRHRARPLPAAEAARWETVWDALRTTGRVD